MILSFVEIDICHNRDESHSEMVTPSSHPRQ
jgi:hypothetical protein